MKVKVRRVLPDLGKPRAAIGSLKRDRSTKKTKNVVKKDKIDRKLPGLPQSDGCETGTSKSTEFEADCRATLEIESCSISGRNRLNKGAPTKASKTEPTGSKLQVLDDVEAESNQQKVEVQLTKAQKKRHRRREAKLARRAENEKRKEPKKADQEPPTSSSIVLPKRKGFFPQFDTDEKRLVAAQGRLIESHSHVLQIRPIPRKCTPGLLKDLCPLAIHIRLPTKYGAHYAFLHFRDDREMQMAKEMLNFKLLNGKPLRVEICSLLPRDQTNWRTPTERQMSDFDWNVLFVSQLARSTTRFDLAQVFRKASSIRFPTYDDGSSKGVCWLTYRSQQDALQAFETRQGTFIRGSPIYINFALRQKPRPQEPVSEIPDESEPEFAVTAGKRKNPTSDESGSENELVKAPVAKLARLDPNAQRDFSIIGRSTSKDTSSTSKSSRKVMTNNQREISHPKLLNSHQLRRKGGGGGQSKNITLASLESLLRPADTKPKNSKKSKKVTKRGKPAKHR